MKRDNTMLVLGVACGVGALVLIGVVVSARAEGKLPLPAGPPLPKPQAQPKPQPAVVTLPETVITPGTPQENFEENMLDMSKNLQPGQMVAGGVRVVRGPRRVVGAPLG